MTSIESLTILFTVVFVGGFVQSKLGIENSRDIVKVPFGGENTIADYGEDLGIPEVTVIGDGGDDPNYGNEANEDVDLCPKE